MFNTGKSRQMWQSVNTMTGYKPSKKTIRVDDALVLADELNAFYTRFDKSDFRAEQAAVLEEVKLKEGKPVIIEEAEVRRCFRNVNPRGAHGPDSIPGVMLKKCGQSLTTVFTRLFQASISSGQVPKLWKTATVIPVPKKPVPKENNDYRPVALTSIPFKCLERLVLRRLLTYTQPHQDPHQFAYMANRSTEDAINTILHETYTHLEKPKSYVRMLFLDFSSAFNTIQPHLLMSKLLKMEVNPVLIQWVYSFLTNRPQRVKIAGATDVTSSEIMTNTGAPQGCVISPALFTMYTSDCRCEEKGVLQVKFSDDTSISGLIQSNESSYRAAVDDMVSWCEENFLLLNVSKTKELIVDFRRKPPPILPLLINGEQVEVVKEYKYLGTILDSKLDWSANTTLQVKKANQRLHFLRKLRSFDVKPTILSLFYQATVQTIITYNNLCFFGNLKVADFSRLSKLTKAASRTTGCAAGDLQTLFERKATKRTKAILADPAHPLFSIFSSHRTTREASGRLRSMRSRTDRLHKSFVPAAIRLFNQQLKN